MLHALHATFSETRVVTYQAFGEAMAGELLERGGLGGSWRYDRHTRLATDWRFVADRYAFGDRLGRSRILAIEVARAGFDALLTAALTAEWDEVLYKTRAGWRLATRYAPVLVEWSESTPRLVVHGPLVRQLATEWVTGLRDVTDQFKAIRDGARPPPAERLYPLTADASIRMGIRS
ncbi:MAG: DUF4291 family protein [Deltaproteobacteria bacterium]|nr:DUF4291 family protein [Deltaproteobacteria bacterium]